MPGQTLETRGWGFAGSLETGYPMALGWGMTLEPEAQLIYQHISLDNGQDAYGRIGYGDIDSLYGRVGARLSKVFTLDDGQRVTTYVRANLWRNFGGDANTTFTDFSGLTATTLKTDLGGARGQVGFGVSGQLTANVSAFASADYNFSLGEDRRGHSWSGRAGFRIVW